MGGKCYLCDRSSSKEEKISLHSFPNPHKDPKYYKKYLDICDLNERDNTSTLKICSRHYDKSDLFSDFAKPRLKKGAFPIINVPNPAAALKQEIPDEDETPTTSTLDLLAPKTESPADPMIQESIQVPANATVTNLCNMDDLDSYFSVLYSYLEQNTPVTTLTYPMEVANEPSELYMETIWDHNYFGTGVTTDGNDSFMTEFDGTRPEEETACSVSNELEKKRKYYYPRFVSEIQISDMLTPEGATQILTLVKEADLKKSNKIHRLNQRKRRLEKRVSNLQQKLSQTKKLLNKKKSLTRAEEIPVNFEEEEDFYEI